MKQDKRGQTAFEYMLVMGMAIALLAPLLTYVNTQTSGIRSDLKRNALQDGLNSVTEASEMVWTQGSPAKMTVSIKIPDNVENITVESDIIIAKYEMGGNLNDLISTSNAPLKGKIPKIPGTHDISIKAQESYVNISY